MLAAFDKKPVFQSSSAMLMIQEKAENLGMMQAMLTNLFINIMLFIFVLAFILN